MQYQLTELLLFYCQVMKVNMVLRKVWFDELSLKAHTYMKTLSDVEVVLSIWVLVHSRSSLSSSLTEDPLHNDDVDDDDDDDELGIQRKTLSEVDAVLSLEVVVQYPLSELPCFSTKWLNESSF